jgi:hypothetical protein
LGYHDRERGEGCTANTRDSEELDEAGYVVAFADDLLLDFELSVDVVEVTGGLEWVVAES